MASNQDTISSGTNAVHTGFWIDWDRGKILGATLTLRDSHAAPLLAALATLVAIASNRSWHICRIFWHSFLRAKDDHEEVVKEHRRRQQVILRNSETAGGATWNLFDEWFDFGVTKVLRECSPKDIVLGIFATGHWILFIALGVIVSQIVLGKVVVSKALPTCGQWYPATTVGGTFTQEGNRVYSELLLNQTLNVDSYVRSCYPRGGSQGILDCNKFVTRSLSYQVQHDRPCPFNSTACMPDARSTVILESGNITLSNLGLNSKYSKEISIQRRSTCAVLDADIFRIRQASSPNASLDYLKYSFWKEKETGKNAELIFKSNNQFSDDYKLVSFFLVYNPEDIALPIRPKTFTSNEVTIILLQGLGVSFLQQQDDPWFSVHTRIEYNNDTGTIQPNYVRYRMDNFLNVISCMEQFRFCSSITSRCTEFQGLTRGETLKTADYVAFGLKGANATDETDLRRIIILLQLVMPETALHRSIQGRGGAAMQATRYLNDGEQLQLATNQWKIELESWFRMSLARLQLEIFNTIERPQNVDQSRAVNIWKTNYEPLLTLCGRIKFRSPSHTSLSTFGLIMILVFSGVLMLGSLVGIVLPTTRWTRRWKTVIGWKRDEVLVLLEKTQYNNSLEVQEANVEYSVVARNGKNQQIRPLENDHLDPFLIVQ
ncbi:hypothetical protein BGZ60DRAFT_121531 [Tricladium varicosporioides]|nr:hypothetical protein BGZ60DRAFT_121531 [Hymenoscyphus varicosporioides]